MNELLLLLTAATSIVLVLIMWKLGKERLYSAIIVFLILVATMGSKIITVFGYHTNAGNIFYASVFLATYFLIERFGKKEGIRSIWVGIICVMAFSILVKLSVMLSSPSEYYSTNQSFAAAFSPVSRLAFASLFAYTISQNVNVHFYIYLKKRIDGRYLWLRANVSNAIAQIVDSIIFFTIAFSGAGYSLNVLEIMLTGIAIKIAFMMLASPILYLNRIETDDDEEYAMITMR